MITCTRKLEWDAMHRIPGHTGACRAYHGHRYVGYIECQGEVKEDGMIIDFSVVKKVVGAWIDKHWDHTAILHSEDKDEAVQHIINTNKLYGKDVYLMASPPTAENIAAELFSVSRELLSPFGVRVASVTLYETPNCFAKYVP